MMCENLSSSISQRASEFPAIIVPNAQPRGQALTVSYQRLHAETRTFQDKLARLGIAPQSAVSIAVPNSYEFTVAFLAATFQRAIAAPLNPSYKQDEFDFYISDLSSALLLVPPGAYAQNSPAVRAARKHDAAIAECSADSQGNVILDVKEKGKLASAQSHSSQQAQADDVALVLHTSGTTGRPKAVPLTHRNLTTTMRNIVRTYELTSQDCTLLVMPLFHVHGLLAAFLAPLASGGTVVIQPGGFSASTFFRHFKDHRCTWYTAVPTIHQILLKSLPSPQDRAALRIRFIRSCSSPLPTRVFEELEEALSAPVLEAYAMTEAAHQMTSNPLPKHGKSKPGSVGVGYGTDMRILALDQDKELPQGREGEICVRGANVTPGYLNNAEANSTSFTPSGFFRTGDQGKKDDDGYVIITGRIKELINKGGEKISPIEIDNVVSRIDGVAEAVCFAMPDEKYGQDVGVAVVVKEQAHVTEEDVQRFMRERVAKFKVPRRVWITKVMPKTATGKIQRRMVAEEMMKMDRRGAKL